MPNAYYYVSGEEANDYQRVTTEAFYALFFYVMIMGVSEKKLLIF